MTRMLLAMILTGTALPLATSGQSHPDFSGTWAMDVQRSVSPTYPEFGGAVTLVIKQSDTAITIETKRGDRSATVTYLPGRPGSTPTSGVDPVGPASPASRYYWEGTTLVQEDRFMTRSPSARMPAVGRVGCSTPRGPSLPASARRRSLDVPSACCYPQGRFIGPHR